MRGAKHLSSGRSRSIGCLFLHGPTAVPRCSRALAQLAPSPSVPRKKRATRVTSEELCPSSPSRAPTCGFVDDHEEDQRATQCFSRADKLVMQPFNCFTMPLANQLCFKVEVEACSGWTALSNISPQRQF